MLVVSEVRSVWESLVLLVDGMGDNLLVLRLLRRCMVIELGIRSLAAESSFVWGAVVTSRSRDFKLR
jgi:hypothetical protein